MVGSILDFVRMPGSRRLWSFVIVLGLYATAVRVFDYTVLGDDVRIPSNLHSLLGTVLGLFLVFRTNTAYDRWWEGRKLWGQLVNDSRNACLKVRSLVKIDPEDAHHFGRLLVNFAKALKEHLREGIRPRQLSVFRNVVDEPRHVPNSVAGMVCGKLRIWRAQGLIDGYDHLLLDPHARALLDICGGCERIRKTPISYSYLAFIRQSIGLYLMTLPWGLVRDYGYWTVPATMIVAYFMIGIELIAEEVGEPFGRGTDDLVLDDICQGLEANITEILSKPPAAVAEVAAVGPAAAQGRLP